MKTFEEAGEAMMMAHAGDLILARALLSTLKGWSASFKAWLDAMPTTLPPTEAHRG